MHFLEWKYLNFENVFFRVWQKVAIGSDNGLAPNRQEGIIKTNDDLASCCKYESVSATEK